MDGWIYGWMEDSKKGRVIRKEREDVERERHLVSIEVCVLMPFCSQVENSRVLHARHGLCKITDH